MKSGPKAGPDFGPVLGLFNIGTLSAGNAPIFGSEFGRRGTATTFTLELAWNRKSGERGSKI